MRIGSAALAGSLLPIAANAAETAVPDAPLSGGLMQAILGLAIVLALIWGAAWLMRRLQPGIAGGRGVLKLVGAQSVGQRERIVVVEIAEQWLVVGVAPGHVSALATLPKGEAPGPVNPPAGNPFQALLARAKRDRE